MLFIRKKLSYSLYHAHKEHTESKMKKILHEYQRILRGYSDQRFKKSLRSYNFFVLLPLQACRFKDQRKIILRHPGIIQ